MQADMGPGRTHTPVSWVKATTHLKASEQPVHAQFVLRHIMPNALVSASNPSQSTWVQWPLHMNEWPLGRLRKADGEQAPKGSPSRDRRASKDSLSPAPRQSAAIGPPLSQETLG